MRLGKLVGQFFDEDGLDQFMGRRKEVPFGTDVAEGRVRRYEREAKVRAPLPTHPVPPVVDENASTGGENAEAFRPARDSLEGLVALAKNVANPERSRRDIDESIVDLFRYVLVKIEHRSPPTVRVETSRWMVADGPLRRNRNVFQELGLDEVELAVVEE